MVTESFSARQTEEIAYKIGKMAKAGDVVCLNGELGAGKTVFAKGFAKGLEISNDITSPTFSIINEYSGRLPLYHFDTYRIKSVREMEDTGYEEYFYDNGVCLIEWADIIRELLPENAVFITIAKDLKKGENYRMICFEGISL